MTGNRTLHVVGAGIVGVACALRMQLQGYRVTLIDPDEPGKGCSYGNAGILQLGACVPVATSGVLRDVPQMLIDQNQPLAIRWPYIFHLLPYLTRFIVAARPAEVERISHVLANILSFAVEGFSPLLKAAHAEKMFTKTGELYVYETDRSFQAAKSAHEMRRRLGVNIEYLDQSALRELEPALGPIFKHAAYLTDCVSVRDPFDLTNAFLDAFFDAGGTHLREKVIGFEKSEGCVHKIITNVQSHPCDNVLLAAGAWSKPLARMLGAKVPLDTERGYHVQMQNAGVDLRVPVISGDYRFGVSNLSSGFRVAGTAELASVKSPPNFARADRLIGLAKRMFPNLNTSEVDKWMGCRPSMPDSLPVICKSSKYGNTVFAFGHGHLGLTMAGITSEFVCDLVEGRTPRLDISALRCDRFKIWRQ